MIKKVEIALVILLLFLVGLIIFTMNKNKNENRIMPSDVVYEFFDQMCKGNFEEAFDTYVDVKKDSQIVSLYSQELLYKEHWARYGIEIESETYNDREKKARVEITVYKLNCIEILTDVKMKMLNINPLKEDGTLITEEEINELTKQYIKDAFNAGSKKYGVIKCKYEINLVKTEDEESWLIVNDSNISDILFGTKSNLTKEDDENSDDNDSNNNEEVSEYNNEDNNDQASNMSNAVNNSNTQGESIVTNQNQNAIVGM